MNAHPYWVDGSASHPLTSSVTSADRNERVIVNEAAGSYCRGVNEFHVDVSPHSSVILCAVTIFASSPVVLVVKSSSCARFATHPWGRSKFKRAISSSPSPGAL